MEQALHEPTAIGFESQTLAKAWRFTCYSLRQSLRVSGDTRFDSLSFVLRNTILEITNAHSQDQNQC